MNQHQPIVLELTALLKARPDLVEALIASIRKADVPGVADLFRTADLNLIQAGIAAISARVWPNDTQTLAMIPNTL